MIETRNGKQVDHVELKRGEWCSFTSVNGTEYVVTNAQGKLVVTKPLKTRRLNPTLEMRAVFGSKIIAR